MSKLIIFIGPPAGGKTSAARLLAKEFEDPVLVEMDEIKKKLSGSVFANGDTEEEREMDREMWFKQANLEIIKGLSERSYVIVDEGFHSNYYLRKLLSNVSVKPLVVKIFFSLKEHLSRDSKRKDKTDPNVLERVYDLFINSDMIVPDFEIIDPNLSLREIIKKIRDLI